MDDLQELLDSCHKTVMSGDGNTEDCFAKLGKCLYEKAVSCRGIHVALHDPASQCKKDDAFVEGYVLVDGCKEEHIKCMKWEEAEEVIKSLRDTASCILSYNTNHEPDTSHGLQEKRIAAYDAAVTALRHMQGLDTDRNHTG